MSNRQGKEGSPSSAGRTPVTFRAMGGRTNRGPATDIEPVDFVQRVFRQDRSKLQDPDKVAVQPCGFGIAEDEHFNPRAD